MSQIRHDHLWKERRFPASEVQDSVILPFGETPCFRFFGWVLSELMILRTDGYSANNKRLFPGAELIDKVDPFFPESWWRIYYFTFPYS